MKKMLFILSILFAFASYGQRIVDGDQVIARDSININDLWWSVTSPSNGQLMQIVGGRLVNSTVSLTPWDSLYFENLTDGDIDWYQGGIKLGDIDIDGRYLLLTDTTDYVQFTDSITEYITPTNLTDSLDLIRSGISAIASSFEITLPVNGTLSGSVSAAVEGTDYPTGWVLSVSGGDLQIQHSLSKYPSSIIVKYNTTGSTYRQLRSFDNAYSGVLEVDTDNVTIESISAFYTAYKLKIKISF